MQVIILLLVYILITFLSTKFMVLFDVFVRVQILQSAVYFINHIALHVFDHDLRDALNYFKHML